MAGAAVKALRPASVAIWTVKPELRTAIDAGVSAERLYRTGTETLKVTSPRFRGWRQ